MKISVVIDNQTYLVDIEDIHARPVIASIEGNRYEVWLEKDTASSEADQTAQKAGPVPVVVGPTQTGAALAGPSDNRDAKNVVSPLPGVIVEVMVDPGETVSHGQELCILEAMKMKNAIRANRDGVIASINVVVGDQVDHGQVMMTYEA